MARDKDMEALTRLIVGSTNRAGSTDSATQTQQRMESFVAGIKMPTTPSVYKHPKVPPVGRPALLSKHR
jgi:hypothetical protein